jgi:hypothetical protein
MALTEYIRLRNCHSRKGVLRGCYGRVTSVLNTAD